MGSEALSSLGKCPWYLEVFQHATGSRKEPHRIEKAALLLAVDKVLEADLQQMSLSLGKEHMSAQM